MQSALASPIRARRADVSGASGRILVIDDDDSMCDALSTALTRRGFTVEWRTHPFEALTLLRAGEFDVVVTDLNMEGMDGIGVCEEVGRSHPGLPVVLVTGFGTDESAARARRVGVWAFINKPFDLEVLRATLARAVLHRRGTSI